jgi:hypothetical protein
MLALPLVTTTAPPAGAQVPRGVVAEDATAPGAIAPVRTRSRS